MSETLPKSERLSGAIGVTALFEHGKGISHGCLRCKYLPSSVSAGPGQGPSRIVVSVPKRLFKRAVKRNLLKRRIRESYRRQKGLLSGAFDILFIYTSPEVQPYEVIFADMTALLAAISEKSGAQLPDNE